MPEVHEFRYSAFISYRHVDNAEPGRQWANWLHQLLETYAVPPELVGTQGARGDPVPASLYPVFLDRQELRADAALGVPIQEALRASRMLVVVCTPRAVQSQHVAEEIRLFKHLGRGDRILAVIVAGEPFADEPVKLARDRIVPANECLPEPLRFALAADGSVDRMQRVEPNFTDLRAEGLTEGFTTLGDYRRDLERRGIFKRAEIVRRVESYRSRRDEAELKLVAGVLGIPLGQLKPRALERQLRAERRKRRLSGAIAVAVLLLAAVAGIGWWQAQRAEAVSSKLVKWMRQDMRNDLFQAGEVGLIADSGEQIEQYFANRMSFGGTREAEGEFALQEMPMGEFALFLGRPDIAEQIYRDAFAAERHAHRGVDFYEMQMARIHRSNALAALGRIADARTELETALAAARTERGPHPLEAGAAWILVEAQAALAELAAEIHAADAVPALTAAHDVVERWAQFPHDPKARDTDLKIAKAWLRFAAAQEKTGDAAGAEKSTATAVEALARADAVLPNNSEVLEQLGLAHSQLGRLRSAAQDFAAAQGEDDTAAKFLARASALHPDSEALRHEWAEARGQQGDALAAVGTDAQALACYHDRHRVMLELALHQSASRRWKFDLADAAIKLAANPAVGPEERSRLVEEASWCLHELGTPPRLRAAEQKQFDALQTAVEKAGHQ